MPEATEFAAVVERDTKPVWISRSEVLAVVNRGKVVLVPGILRRLGIIDTAAETIVAAVRVTSGPELAEGVRRHGLEKIHDLLDGAQIEATLRLVNARLEPNYPWFTKAVVQELMGPGKAFYVHRTSMLRFMTPHEIAVRNVALFTRREHLGRLDPHAPHQDHWFGVPLNTINLWMAISRIEADNSVCIFPDAWTAELPQNGRHTHHDQYLGVPLRITCDAGDLVLFHNRHVHGTNLNVTQSTRFAITTRFCAERPIAQTTDVLDGGCLYSPLVGTRFQPYANAATRLSWVYLLERAKQIAAGCINGLEGRIRRSIPGSGLAQRVLRYRRGDVAQNIPPAIRRSLVAVEPEEVAEGRVEPLDPNRCAARIDGELFIFDRRCPHEGGDLAAGYVRDGKVYCPRHNYWIDPATGRGPCASIAPVRTYHQQLGAEVAVAESNREERHR